MVQVVGNGVLPLNPHIHAQAAGAYGSVVAAIEVLANAQVRPSVYAAHDPAKARAAIAYMLRLNVAHKYIVGYAIVPGACLLYLHHIANVVGRTYYVVRPYLYGYVVFNNGLHSVGFGGIVQSFRHRPAAAQCHWGAIR